MINKQVITQILAALSVVFCFQQLSHSQAEYPGVVKTYVRINDNNKQIKASKISISTEILTAGGKEDTIKYTIYDTDGYLVKEVAKVDTSADKKGEFITKNYTYIYNNYKLLIVLITPFPTTWFGRQANG